MNILDEDLSDDDAAYRAYVDRAPELIAAIEALVRERGEQPNIHYLHHVWWRFLKENRRWRTVRDAMLDREPDRPVPPAAQPEVPPSRPATHAPSRPGTCIKIADGPFHPRFYSYWPNAWVRSDGATFVFGGGLDNHARFFRLDSSGRTDDLGGLLPIDGTTEGWYWDAHGWLYIPDGPRLLRVNPFTQEREVVFDVSRAWSGVRVWQAHSSDDGSAHCATLQHTDTWEKVATVICSRGEPWKVDARADLDESDIDASGQWVVIKEGAGPDNRIVCLDTRDERTITDAEGAFGHSAMGAGFIVGEVDKPEPGRCVLMDLRTGRRTDLFQTWNMGHVAVRGDRVLVSNATARELALVDVRDGSYRTLLTDIPGWGRDYDSQVRANLSPCGTRACFMAGGAIYMIPLP